MTNLSMTFTTTQKPVLEKAVRTLRSKITSDLKTLKTDTAIQTAQLMISELEALEAVIGTATEYTEKVKAPRKERVASGKPRNSTGIRTEPRAPIMNSNRGRHWINVPLILQDGAETNCFYDKVYGARFFWIDGKMENGEDQWWAAQIHEFNTSTDPDVMTPDLRTRKRR